MVVDDNVIWAPTVQSIAEAPAGNNVLTGSGPYGLTKDAVDWILTRLAIARVVSTALKINKIRFVCVQACAFYLFLYLKHFGDEQLTVPIG